MEYTVSATDLANIQLNEEDRVKEILRNVAVILATPKGSVPMYRRDRRASCRERVFRAV